MDKGILRYNKSIDKKVKTAIEQVFKTDILSVEKMQNGEVNHVYKVTTSKGNLLMRVMRNKYWPEEGKLKWIEKQLTKHKIPHAKILYYSHDSKYFSNGFMVTEFLEGMNGWVAVNRKKISLEQSFVEIGKILKKVHHIKIKKFGHVNYGKGVEKDFIKAVLANAQKHLTEPKMMKLLKPDMYEIIREAVTATLAPYQSKFKAVLVHADPSRENAIYTRDKQWILIDWDNAFSGAWMEDLADLTFWTDYNRSRKEAQKRRELILKNFFKGYGKTNLNSQEIQDVEKALHIIKCAKLFPYYFFNQKRMDNFNYTKNKLYRLLRENP